MAGDSPARTHDLETRTLTAVVMLLVSGTALWLGGMWWTVFVIMVGAGVWFEWSTLCLLMHSPGPRRTTWRYAGAAYCGIACAMLLTLRDLPLGIFWVLLTVGAVIGVDIGAYFFGRAIGGPKIAPSISPSKTWAGLLGGIAGASLVIGLLLSRIADPQFAAIFQDEPAGGDDTYFVTGYFFGGMAGTIALGALVAVVAQFGDFFESSMKRRAGVKDSGNTLPGHGGLFDRVDGLLSVLFVMAIVFLVALFGGMA